MTLLLPLIFAALSLALPDDLVLSNVAPENFFAHELTPAPGSSEAIGFYSAGCLRGAVAMDLKDAELAVMKPSRHRYYGHPALLSLLKRAKTEAPRAGPILVGDLSQPRGGPMPMGHASHQLGLDADIWFTPKAILGRGSLKEEEREGAALETVLDKSRKKIEPARWHASFAEQILWFAGQPEVQRIFVHGAIKKRLCASHRHHPALPKVRPWYFHDSHYHVRLRCPVGSPGCKPQADPAEAGCDASIDPWLTPAALKIQRELPKVGIPRRVNLPAACRGLSSRDL
ncbi:MAG: penicillin-insensitive murein endopeptidase [Proteobacteria bacterium]|nr:MAG: penicillin-insensitive murein endopeptidase [Pseudomonadota bacterium]